MSPGDDLPVYIDADFTTAITHVTNGLGDCIDMIKAEPLFLLPLGVAFLGACIALARGLFRYGRRRGR